MADPFDPSNYTADKIWPFKPGDDPRWKVDLDNLPPVIKITRRYLNVGRSCMGGLSTAQLALLGVEISQEKYGNYKIPYEWIKQVVGTQVTREVYLQFVALKDKHINPATIRNQTRANARYRARKNGEEYQFDRDIFLGIARRMVDGVETIYRVGPPMTREQIRAVRRERMLKGAELNDTKTAIWGRRPFKPKPCIDCGVIYTPTAPAHQRCDPCARQYNRFKHSEYERKRRAKCKAEGKSYDSRLPNMFKGKK